MKGVRKQGTPLCLLLRNDCSTSFPSDAGSILQKLPFPGSSCDRGTLTKYRFNDKLCLIEFWKKDSISIFYFYVLFFIYLPPFVCCSVIGIIFGNVWIDSRKRQLLLRSLRNSLYDQLSVGKWWFRLILLTRRACSGRRPRGRATRAKTIIMSHGTIIQVEN